MLRTMLMTLAFLPCACPSDAGPATPVGEKLIDWKRGPTAYKTGVSLGEDIGPAVVEDKTVVFTPKEPRNEKLGEVRLSLHIERGEVHIEANPAGERPTEKAVAPRTIQVTLAGNNGWQVSGSCEPAVSALASVGPRRVGVAQRCSVRLQSGKDSGEIHLSVVGDGKVDTVASFGSAELL